MGVNRRNPDQYLLRLPPGLRDQIQADADRNGRSMNAEIIARLSGTQDNLRDQIAMAALTGLIASGHTAYDLADSDQQAAYAAFRAYTAADAMLNARALPELPADLASGEIG